MFLPFPFYTNASSIDTIVVPQEIQSIVRGSSSAVVKSSPGLPFTHLLMLCFDVSETIQPFSYTITHDDENRLLESTRARNRALSLESTKLLKDQSEK
eukprot:gene7444-5242_t